MNRLADRLAALVLAVFCDCLPGAGLSADRRRAAALACLAGGLLFWAGFLPGRPAHAAGAPLFGRAAGGDGVVLFAGAPG